MRFDFSEQQSAFGDSARRLFSEIFPESVVRNFTEQPTLNPQWAPSIAGAGLLSILAPEDIGGLGLPLVDAVPVAIEAARAIVPFPVSESMVAAAALAKTHPDIATAIIDGRTIVAVDDLSGLKVSGHAGAVKVEGTLSAVPWAGAAQWLIGPARSSGGDQMPLVLIDLADATRTAGESFDRTISVVDITFAGTSASVLGLGDGSSTALTERLEVLAAAELFGLGRFCLDRSVEYARTREQFGKPIGSYQAIKHLLATAAVKLESMLLAIQYAAWAVDADAHDRDLAVLSARTYCASAAREICEDMIQLHGGIGFTWDFGLHFYLRRAIRLGTTLGSTSAHRDDLAGLLFDRLETSRGLHP